MSNPIIPVPTLSLDGWVKSTAEKADYLISHFYLSERSQTFLYLREVASMQWIVQETQGDPSSTCKLLREEISKYFGRYFTNVTVDATFSHDPPNSGKIAIRFFVSFTDNFDKEFILSRLVNILNSKIETISKINNTGPSF